MIFKEEVEVHGEHLQEEEMVQEKDLRPPDIDAIIRDIQNKINKFLPGGSSSGGKPIGLILIILAFVWLASGLYRV